jgi:hypothetical protein
LQRWDSKEDSLRAVKVKPTGWFRVFLNGNDIYLKANLVLNYLTLKVKHKKIFSMLPLGWHIFFSLSERGVLWSSGTQNQGSPAAYSSIPIGLRRLEQFLYKKAGLSVA